jgi:type VI secretion system secreted protein VgrG
VVVTFEGGDPDKPIVLGALYNGTHPPPFLLPGEKTRSGIRTQSTPGGSGSNELMFDDAVGREQIYVHAQKNLNEVVERNHTRLVKNDDFIRVLGERMDTIEHSLAEHVKGDRNSKVDGNRIERVGGSTDEHIAGAQVTRVEGNERRSVKDAAALDYTSDLTTRVKGCMTTIVGKHDRKRSWVTHAEGKAKLSSLDTTEVSSESAILLRVGKSWLRMTSDQIELVSPAISAKGAGGGLVASDDGLALSSKGDATLVAKKRLLLKTERASIAMNEEVKVDGTKILLNSPEQASDPPPEPSSPPTKVKLTDTHGKPLAYQRFLVTMDDGSEVSDITDADGNAEMDLEGGGKITFPDVKHRA